MNGILATIFALAVPFALSAASIAALESEAAKELTAHGRGAAAKNYLAAAQERAKAAKTLYESKEELELETADDDDGLSLGGTAAARDTDAEALHYLATAVDFDYGGRPLVADEWMKKAKAVAGTSAAAREKIAAEERRIAAERDPTEPPDKAPAAKKAAPPKKPTNSYEALKAFDLEAVRAFNAGPYPYLWKIALEEYENFRSFPKDEAETVAPKSFAWEPPPKAKGDAAKEPKPRTVVVGELDWDENDATACVEEALASGAGTVIFEDKGGPWRIRSMRPRPNQRLVFRKGVKILKDNVSRMNRDRSPLVLLKDVWNVVLEGEGDVFIGGYESAKEREGFTKEEGASGVVFAGARNVILRNLAIGYNACDGISFGGANAVWIEDVVLKGNYRQAMSCCNCRNVFCRRVSFLDTAGGAPGCGIDFEPTYEIELNASLYFYDCVFGNNDGGAVNFSSSSYLPVTAQFRRCRFLKQRGAVQFNVFARCGVYMEANVKAPGRILLEDAEMEGPAGFTPVQIENANLFDVEVRNLKAPGAGPIAYSLKRDYAMFPAYDHERNSGSLKIEPPAEVAINDKVGTYPLYNAAGKSYLPPELGLVPVPRFDPADYLPPAKTVAEKGDKLPKGFFFIYSGSWYSKEVVYRALYWEDGWKMKKILAGVPVGNLGISDRPIAYYVRGGEGIYKMESPANRPFRVYFEVPAAEKASVIKIHSGSGTLFDAAGKAVQEFARTESAQYLRCTPASGKAEIWSIEFTSPAIYKFFAPFNGIISESPDALPRHR